MAEGEDTDVEGIADIVVGDIPDNGDEEEEGNLDMHDTAAVVDIVEVVLVGGDNMIGSWVFELDDVDRMMVS